MSGGVPVQNTHGVFPKAYLTYNASHRYSQETGSVIFLQNGTLQETRQSGGKAIGEEIWWRMSEDVTRSGGGNSGEDLFERVSGHAKETLP